MKRALTIMAVAVFATSSGCASKPPPAEALQSVAVSTAQQHGAADLGCPAATAKILNKETIQEAQGTGWYEYPHRAAYTVEVSGCEKRATYSLTCDNRQKSCVAGPVAVSSAPRQLADELQPGAVSAAQQRGTSELGCEAVTTKVLRQETIQEAQGTGWYEQPHRAAYTIDVSGCGKRAGYLVSCDDRQKNCVAGTLQKKTEGGPPQLADKLQPDAVRVAQQHGAADLGCPAATTEVLRQETIEEAQTTGWYEIPHRAAYSIAVSGCGKRATYAVACDDREKSVCIPGKIQN
jgi:hypothetical protein